MAKFNEDTRVKIPATIQFLRLGYDYQSLKDIDLHTETRIAVNRFKPAIEKINGRSFSDEEIQAIIADILSVIKNNDLGKAFYKWLINPQDRVKLIDFDCIENNNFAVVDELTFGKEGTESEKEGSFRPDITVLINGIPLAFLEVKHPNNEGGIQAEFNRMLNKRLEKPEYKKYFNMLQLVTFSNNMEYESEDDSALAEDVKAGSFYTTPNGQKTSFSFFREEQPKTTGFIDISTDKIKAILKDNHYSPMEADTPEFHTNLDMNSPCNRFVTSFFQQERILYFLHYGLTYVNGTVPEKHVMRYPQFFASKALVKRLDTIQYLINHLEQQDFYKQFDDALVRISKNVKNEAFAVETADGEKTDLFEPLTVMVESAQRNNFAKAIFGIIAKDKFDFSEAFGGSFDFYSAIFEYLIKNYNVASGTYAEYFTPQTVSSIIAKILVGMSDTIEAAEIYDPAAGSGSLILHLAHELGQEGGMNRAIVYTQDISKKSTRFLRLNMMLNGKSESLGNIIRGDTLESPAHFNVEHEPDSGVKKFDYITTNPPFKTDFSATRDRIEQKWQDTSRFFAGVPKIPNAKKESMAIYLLFIQHVLYSLKEDGKAAIVVPTGFLTAKSGIEFAIREKMVKGHMLKGVISMPSNIFANTGTNVSVIFLDKANTAEDVILIDASKLGEKVKEGKNQKTVLRDFEVQRIIETFIQRNAEDDFSVIIGYDKFEEKGYSFSAGQYFEVKIEYVDITAEEFEAKMNAYKEGLTEKFQKGHELEESIIEQIGGLFYV